MAALELSINFYDSFDTHRHDHAVIFSDCAATSEESDEEYYRSNGN